MITDLAAISIYRKQRNERTWWEANGIAVPYFRHENYANLGRLKQKDHLST